MFYQESQGTVLTSLLFIMIVDVDQEVKESVVRCFTDDTRASKMKGSEDDKEKIRSYLNI